MVSCLSYTSLSMYCLLAQVSFKYDIIVVISTSSRRFYFFHFIIKVLPSSSSVFYLHSNSIATVLLPRLKSTAFSRFCRIVQAVAHRPEYTSSCWFYLIAQILPLCHSFFLIHDRVFIIPPHQLDSTLLSKFCLIVQDLSRFYCTVFSFLTDKQT